MNQRYVPLTSQPVRDHDDRDCAGIGGDGAARRLHALECGRGSPSNRFLELHRLRPRTSTRAPISGSITDSTSAAPIGGATVSSGGRSTTTQANCAYTLPTLPPARSTSDDRSQWLRDRHQPGRGDGGQTTSLDVAMSRPGDISGVVTNSGTGAALAGVTVGYPGGVTVTDSTGPCRHPTGSPAGSHDLTFAATGFVSADRTATVTAGSVTTWDVQLARPRRGSPECSATPSRPRSCPGRPYPSTPLIPRRPICRVGTGSTCLPSRTRLLLRPPATFRPPVPRSSTAGATSPSTSTWPARRRPARRSRSRRPPDSTVKSSDPTENYGKGTRGQAAYRHVVELDGRSSSYLRFANSPGWPDAASRARSRGCASPTPDPRRRDPLSDGQHLDRDRITYNNAPAATGESAPYRRGGDRRAMGRPATPPAAPTFTADGSIDFALMPNQSKSVYYSSREGADAPQLVVDVGGGATPTPTLQRPRPPPC